ncbi:hypothetical protein DFJ63DRAFT_169367 [Scheffersomyces coipomensis]|uniref:uncharacterized protein n=1 Tax=Scheffersomyces coipomensis TaxID=1788519 RepID=UPI00315C6828
MNTQRLIRSSKSILTKRSYSTVNFSHINEAPKAPKPQIRQFSNPLLHTFLFASSTYILLNSIWLSLEHENKEKELLAKSKLLEDTIQELLDQKKVELEHSESSRKWYKLWLWK